MKIVWPFPSLLLLVGLIPTVYGQPILSVDFNDRDNTGLTMPGFDPFVIDATASTPVTRTFGGLSVTLTGSGANYDDRVRLTPTNNVDFTQSLLLRDFVFCGTATTGTGLDFLVEGLTEGTTYQFTFWSFDSGSTGNRVSDWSANGFPVVTDYVFNGLNSPTNDTQYQFSFRVPVSASGQILVQGRRDAATSSQGSVFVNALQIALSTPDPPPGPFGVAPLNPVAASGSTVTFNAVGYDSRPLLFQWQRNDGLGGFTNIPAATATAYTTPALLLEDDGSQFRCVASNLFGSATTEAATLTVYLDTNAPTVLSMQTEYPYTNVIVTFSEPVDSTDAVDPFNYMDLGGMVLWSGIVMLDASTVVLQAADPLVEGTTYTFRIQFVKDLAPQPNMMADTNFTFTVTTRLSIDFNERGSEAGMIQFGFNSFVIESEISSTTIQTNPTTRVFGPISVTVLGTGPDPGYDDRLRNTPTNSAAFTEELLLRDFVFSRATTVGEGLDIQFKGLTDGVTYQFTLWSFDSTTTGSRLSDWSANGSLVRDDYFFNGSLLPTNNTQYQLNFKVTAPSSGEVLIAGRNNSAQLNVFLNALRLEVSTPDAPAIVQDPAPLTLYAGDNAVFTAQVSGTAPLHFQWRKDGEDLPGATGDTLIITNASVGAAGLYSVTVTNTGGSASSAAAQLTVLPVDTLQSGLLAHWPLDVLTDTTPDLGLFLQDLTQTNMASSNVVSGVLGNALDFNGTNQLLVRELTPGGGLPAYAYPAYTVALWAKGLGVGQADRRVYAEGSTTNNNPLLTIGTANHGTNGTVDIFIRNDNGAAVVNHFQSGLEAFDSNWHHIAWVDNSGFGRIHVDGIPDTNELVYTRGVLTPNAVAVGGLQRAAPSHWFTGQIDDVAVWRRALSPAEVQQVARFGLTLGIAGIAVQGDNLVLTILTTDPTATHRVDEATDLGAPIWTPVPNVSFGTSDGNRLTATFSRPAEGQRFYRAVQP